MQKQHVDLLVVLMWLLHICYDTLSSYISTCSTSLLLTVSGRKQVLLAYICCSTCSSSYCIVCWSSVNTKTADDFLLGGCCICFMTRDRHKSEHAAPACSSSGKDQVLLAYTCPSTCSSSSCIAYWSSRNSEAAVDFILVLV